MFDRLKYEEILRAARALTPGERSAHLDRACSDDARLRAAIETVLRDEAATTVEVPASGHPTPVLGGDSYNDFSIEDDAFDGYRVLSKIGEGGFGIVYLADQISPIRRRVALKVLKPGMDSRAVLARFEIERQSLAVLDHPSIARIFDAGTTRLGRPYFAMEYVPGIPLTQHCDKHRLPIRQRLELFAKVCDAVFYAHTKGIIHRDLKPNNILVTVAEQSEPIPKVIDFGVAKAIMQRPGEHSALTELGLLIGTPEYMSPEQADLDAQDIDVRSDVYSLGVVLYELLTGSLPFDARTLRSGALKEIRRILREVDPPRPSTRFEDASDAAATRAEIRMSRAPDLARTLRRELEWIPLKAMRKDRTERYESASALAQDVRNYLTGMPLHAGPESALYRIRKFARRNRAPVVAVSLVAVSLAAGLAIAARAQYLRAADFERAQGAVAVLTTVLNTAVPAGFRDKDASGGVSTFDRTVAFLEKSGLAGIDPDLAADIATLCAEGYRAEGRPADAIRLAERALGLRRLRFGDDHFATLESRQNIAAYTIVAGRPDRAEQMLIALLPDYLRVLGDRDLKTLNVRATLVSALAEQGKLDAAQQEISALLLACESAGKEGDPTRVNALMNRSMILFREDKGPEAIALAAQLAASEQSARGRRSRTALDARVLHGTLLLESGDPGAAIAVLQPALADMRAVLGDLDPIMLQCALDTASALVKGGKTAESAALLEPLLARCKYSVGPADPRTRSLAASLREAIGDKPQTPEQSELLDGIGGAP